MPSVEELQKQQAALSAQIKQQEQADAALKKAKETPRAPEVVMADLFEALALRIGNRPNIKLLIAEFKAATNQPEPAPTTAPT